MFSVYMFVMIVDYLFDIFHATVAEFNGIRVENFSEFMFYGEVFDD